MAPAALHLRRGHDPRRVDGIDSRIYLIDLIIIVLTRRIGKLEKHKYILLADCKMMLRMLSEVPGHIWDNGVYDPTGTMCEGIVLQNQAECRIQANVDAMEVSG